MTPLPAAAFRNLTVKNRLFRSNISGRLDNYDGSGTQARINWELKFATQRGRRDHLRPCAGVDPRGRIVPNYATIDRDDAVPFWRELGRRSTSTTASTSCSSRHAGRQRDIRVRVPERR